MTIINFVNYSPRVSLYKYFELLNVAQPNPDKRLTEAEIHLLTEFILLPQDKFAYQRFSKVAKRKVMSSLITNLNWKLTQVNLNNKLYSMVEKGYLRRDTDGVIYISEAILTGAQSLLEALNSNKIKDITFRFDYSTSRPNN